MSFRTNGGRLDQLATLHYFQWEEKFTKQKPYALLMKVPDNFPCVNYTNGPGPPERVEDMRGREDEFTLDSHGFAVRSQVLPVIDFGGKHVEEEYFPMVHQLIRDECGPDAEVLIFDWRLRSSNEEKTKHNATEYVDIADPQLHLRPAVGAHVDQTPAAARRRVFHHMPDRAEHLLKSKRFRIINVWRSIALPVEDHPLACCDGSVVRPEDMVPVDSVRSSFIGESWQTMYRDHYRWYYLSNQTKDEPLLIKMFDSNVAAKAKCCPHTSFKISSAPESAAARESIEVRALVFTDS